MPLKSNRSFSFCFISLLLFAFCLPAFSADYSFYTPPTETQPYPLLPDAKVRNVILFIGDGMGLSQVAAARIAACGASGYTTIERMPVTGLVRTHSAKELVTDSAAAATALATGCKTANGMISVAPDGKRLMTILEAATSRGMSTGLVVTDTVTGATPACFASHVSSRGMQAEIAEQMSASKTDVIMGGGRAYFSPKSTPGSKRTDDKDLIAAARAAGYSFAQTRKEMDDVKSGDILGLFEPEGLSASPDPSLADMTAKAIELLRGNRKGFFLMVEGSQIDWACHGNDADNAIRQTLLLDQAVKAAADFALKDRHTLVVITNDHETGGMAILGGNLDGTGLDIKWAKGGHTAAPAPVYAFGPKAVRFTGIHDNTDVPKLIADALSIQLPGAAN